MDDSSNNLGWTSKQENNLRFLRIIWTILIVVFAFIILLRLHDWNEGQDNLKGILSPLGMIFLGLSQIVGRQNKPLYYIFLVIALVLVLGGLVILFIN